MDLDSTGASLLRKLQNQGGNDVPSCLIGGRQCYFLPADAPAKRTVRIVGRLTLDIEYAVVVDPEDGEPSPDPCAVLTSREREIAYLIASGCSNKMIARRLRISCWTVQTHVRRAFAKLGISCRTELAAIIVNALHSQLREPST
jgi:DNA-binding CsgD family transcriptional regulator